MLVVKRLAPVVRKKTDEKRHALLTAGRSSSELRLYFFAGTSIFWMVADFRLTITVSGLNQSAGVITTGKAGGDDLLTTVGRNPIIIGVSDMVLDNNLIDRVRYIAEQVEAHELHPASADS